MGRHSYTPYVLNAPGGGNALSILGGHSTNALTTIFGDLPSLSAEVDTLIPEETLADTGETVRVTSHYTNALTTIFGDLPSLSAEVDTLIPEETLAVSFYRRDWFECWSHLLEVRVTSHYSVAVVGRFESGAMLTAAVSWVTDPLLGWKMYAWRPSNQTTSGLWSTGYASNASGIVASWAAVLPRWRRRDRCGRPRSPTRHRRGPE